MEDTPKLARKLIILQAQLLLYGFDENEARSPGMVEFPIRADPFNVKREFFKSDSLDFSKDFL